MALATDRPNTASVLSVENLIQFQTRHLGKSALHIDPTKRSPLPDWETGHAELFAYDLKPHAGLEVYSTHYSMVYIVHGEVEVLNKGVKTLATIPEGHVLTGNPRGKIVGCRTSQLLHFSVGGLPVRGQDWVVHPPSYFREIYRAQGIPTRSLWGDADLPNGPGCQLVHVRGILRRHCRSRSHTIAVVVKGEGWFACGKDLRQQPTPIAVGSLMQIPAGCFYGVGGNLDLVLAHPVDGRADYLLSCGDEYRYPSL